MQIAYLQRKIRNSPASKLIQSKFQQRSLPLNNNLYSILKQETNVKGNPQKQKQIFDQEIQKKLTEQPVKIISSLLMRKTKNSEIQKRRKKIRTEIFSPKKNYQKQTKASFSKKQIRTRSMLTDYNDIDLKNLKNNSQIKSLKFYRTHQNFTNKRPNERNNTGQNFFNYRTITQQSYESFSLQVQKRKNKKRSFSNLSNTKYSDFSFARISQHDTLNDENLKQQYQVKISTESQLQYFNELIVQFRKSSKKFEEAVLKDQKRFDILEKVNNKISNHFGQLILEGSQFPQIQFDNLTQLKKQQRYKFSSNNILENVLSKADGQVQQWIEMQKNRLLRKKGEKVAREVFRKEILSIQQKRKMNDYKMQNLEHDKKFQSLLQNSEDQLKRLKLQKRILLQKTHCSNGKTLTTPKVSITQPVSHINQMKQYQKKKFINKGMYLPIRKRQLILSK